MSFLTNFEVFRYLVKHSFAAYDITFQTNPYLKRKKVECLVDNGERLVSKAETEQLKLYERMSLRYYSSLSGFGTILSYQLSKFEEKIRLKMSKCYAN